MRLSLQISPCPNDTFAFDALLHGRIDTEGYEFDVAYKDIEELNGSVLAGTPDFSKISCSFYGSIYERYALLDSGAALGRGNGQLLVRRVGDTAPVRKVCVPGLHTTAYALLRRYFPQYTAVEPVLFSQVAQRVESGEFDAGVLIHEGRFVYDRYRLCLVADLGQLWEAETGLPLPLGAIAVRRDLPMRVRRDVERLLAASVRYAFAHPKESRAYVKEHAQELDDTVIDKHIALFVNDFSVSLGAEGRTAMQRLTGCELDRVQPSARF